MEEGRTLSADEKKQALMGNLGKPPEEAPKAEEKPIEQTKESEEKVENTEQKPDAEKQVEKKAEETPTFDLVSEFNKKFGKEFESEDSFNTLFEKADKYDETETTNKDLSQKLSEYKNLAEKLDPMANFLDSDEYIRQQFLIKNKENLNEDAIKTLSVLSPSKVGELSDVDALKTQLMVDSGLTGEEAEAYLLRKYEVSEFDQEEMELGTKAAMKVDVKNAKDSLSKLYDGIDVPERIDYEAARTQIKESWNEPLKAIVDGIDKIQLEEGIDFVVTPEMKEGLFDSTLSDLMSKQVKPSEEAGANLVGALKDRIVLNNISKVVKSIAADVKEQAKAELRKEVHNDKPLESTSRTDAVATSNEDKMRKFL